MALKRITDYTLATTPLAGTEQFEADISGSPFRTTSLDIAKTATQDAINNGTTDRPPSQNAVFDALALKQALIPFAVAAGTADALTADFTPDAVLVDGGDIKVRANAANTGAATLAVDGGAALAITKQGGTALAAGDIAAAGHELQLRYRSSVPRWELMNPKAASATGDVVGPASATDLAIALFSTTTGKLLADSGVLLSALATLAGTNTFTGQNTFAAGTITTSQPLTVTQTWNAAGVTFDAIDVNVTATASAAASRLLNLRVGGSSVAFVRKDGLVSGQILWAGGVTNTTGYVSVRGDPTGAGHYGIGYDSANDATHVYTYATRKLILGSRAFAGTYNARFTFDDAAGVQTWTHSEGINYVFGTTTGTKLGTATSQKLGFWNATPVIQPASASQAAVTDTAGATYTAAEQTMLDNLKTLVNQIRADLVTVGIIKGAV